MNYIGIDGCKKGWFYIGLDDFNNYSFGIIPIFSECQKLIKKAEIVLVDIPIGLREIDTKERLCDLEARKVLGIRRSSVFPPPSRLVLKHTNYGISSKANFEYTGRQLSKQSFAIMNKINEVDEFVRSTGTQGKIREMHPEVCFWALNGKRPMLYNKKKPEGIRERTLLLHQFHSNTEKVIAEAKTNFLRKDVAVDDIIDALVGAVTAKNKNNLRTLPINPESDEKGLKMEIVYYLTTS